jgi:hypothetical protein
MRNIKKIANEILKNSIFDSFFKMNYGKKGWINFSIYKNPTSLDIEEIMKEDKHNLDKAHGVRLSILKDGTIWAHSSDLSHKNIADANHYTIKMTLTYNKDTGLVSDEAAFMYHPFDPILFKKVKQRLLNILPSNARFSKIMEN